MKILIFLGSVRDSSPPSPARLGERVAKACLARFAGTGIDVELVDPLEYDLGGVFKPHFAYTKSTAPKALADLATKIEEADGYVMVSPEYNHSMSPALADLLNHFGASLFAFKASAIVTYSAGQWGGVRAAVVLRSFLAELGCLPVSAMVHVPKAQEAFAADGKVIDSEKESGWKSYFDRSLNQLVWWADAAKEARSRQDPQSTSPAFKRNPAQRNAPG